MTPKGKDQEQEDMAKTVKKFWGEAIKEQRCALGLTQKQLAQAVGVDQSLVSYWEHGDVAPTVERQLAVAKALRIAPRVLFRYPEVA